jgi:hypothetical protein
MTRLLSQYSVPDSRQGHPESLGYTRHRTRYLQPRAPRKRPRGLRATPAAGHEAGRHQNHALLVSNGTPVSFLESRISPRTNISVCTGRTSACAQSSGMAGGCSSQVMRRTHTRLLAGRVSTPACRTPSVIIFPRVGIRCSYRLSSSTSGGSWPQFSRAFPRRDCSRRSTRSASL